MKKIKTVILLLAIQFLLFSQSTNKFLISDSEINVKQTLIDEFGQEMEERIKETEGLDSRFTFSYLELENNLEKESEAEESTVKIPGGCDCFKKDGIIYISNYAGLMAGLNNLIQIKLDDSTYNSKLIYNTDGENLHKLTEQGEFVANIELDIQNSFLFITNDSEFDQDGRVAGKFNGTTVKYYEQDFSSESYKEIQTKVLSIFECTMKDYDLKLIEMEKMKEEK